MDNITGADVVANARHMAYADGAAWDTLAQSERIAYLRISAATLTRPPVPTNVAPTTAATVQVNIGRNVGDEPMPERRWRRLVGLVHGLVGALTGDGTHVDEPHYGSGEWVDDAGVTVREDSAYVFAFGDSAEWDLEGLADALAILADEFGQDAIALVVGHSALVSRREV